MDVLLNPLVRRDAAYRGDFGSEEYAGVSDFYAREAPVTPLRQVPDLARAAGIGELLIKDESQRFGLEAFKIVGARYAFAKLRGSLTPAGVVCATAGNHGRAVARAARESGVPCTVFVPQPASAAGPLERRIRSSRIAAMQRDGACVEHVDGAYEEAVARAEVHAQRTGATMVSDTSWPGAEAIPRLIMLGYTHIFEECARQWAKAPDVVLVQGGVGGLLAAAASWSAWRFGAARPFLIGCEPESHACLLESARAGAPIDLAAEPRAATGASPPATLMSGLRCTRPSASAWPAVAHGVDGFIAIPDSLVEDAMTRLGTTADGMEAGPSGACGLAALLALAGDPRAAPLRNAARLSRSTRAMAVVTEGP